MCHPPIHGPSAPLLTVVSMSLSFVIQEHIAVPGEDGRTDLHCVYCGQLSAAPTEWLAERAGDHMACDHCGVVSQLPAVSKIGV